MMPACCYTEVSTNAIARKGLRCKPQDLSLNGKWYLVSGTSYYGAPALHYSTSTTMCNGWGCRKKRLINSYKRRIRAGGKKRWSFGSYQPVVSLCTEGRRDGAHAYLRHCGSSAATLRHTAEWGDPRGGSSCVLALAAGP